MNLHRFVATSTHKAIATVQETLGIDALIYSTRRVPGGVEVVAGLPLDKQLDENDGKIALQNARLDTLIIERMNMQLQLMGESIQLLTQHINQLQQVVASQTQRKYFWHWRIFKFFNIIKFFNLLRDVRYGREPIPEVNV